jgi:hypothetical protein
MPGALWRRVPLGRSVVQYTDVRMLPMYVQTKGWG